MPAPTATPSLILAVMLTAGPVSAAEPGKAAVTPAKGNWPQWRGPDRSNISRETGLLAEWPKDGPPSVWKVVGLGDGGSPPAVSDGRIYTVGGFADGEYVTALDERTGERLWTARIGPAPAKSAGARWPGRRTPTVDGDRLYALTAEGELSCLSAADGKRLWTKSYSRDFQGARPPCGGYADSPLADGDRVICAPGGPGAALVALNRANGETVWKSSGPGARQATPAAPVICQAGGVRHCAVADGTGIRGISIDEGRLLWDYKHDQPCSAVLTPIADADCGLFFVVDGGVVGLQPSPSDGTVSSQKPIVPRPGIERSFDGSVLIGDHLYACGVGIASCIDIRSGRTTWTKRLPGTGRCSTVCAADRLYVGQEGSVTLVAATPERYSEKGTLRLPGVTASASPVVTGGRLYVRAENVLFCYDVRAGATSRPAAAPSTIELPPPPPAASSGGR